MPSPAALQAQNDVSRRHQGGRSARGDRAPSGGCTACLTSSRLRRGRGARAAGRAPPRGARVHVRGTGALAGHANTDDDRRGPGGGSRRRGIPLLGRRSFEQVPRGDRVRAVPVVAHPLYVGSSRHGRGPRGRVRSLAVAVVDGGISGRHADSGYPKRGGLSAGGVWRALRRYERTRRCGRRPRFSLARALANREHRAVAGLLAALLLMAWKATYNGAFWGTAGARSVEGG